jgi:hypothetical protein
MNDAKKLKERLLEEQFRRVKLEGALKDLTAFLALHSCAEDPQALPCHVALQRAYDLASEYSDQLI